MNNYISQVSMKWHMLNYFFRVEMVPPLQTMKLLLGSNRSCFLSFLCALIYRKLIQRCICYSNSCVTPMGLMLYKVHLCILLDNCSTERHDGCYCHNKSVVEVCAKCGRNDQSSERIVLIYLLKILPKILCKLCKLCKCNTFSRAHIKF